MQKSLMQGLNEKDMQAVINTYDLKPYYYPTLFPLTETPFLTWKMLEGQAGLKIAADIVSRGATIPKKTREAISRIQGDIPKIAVSREKQEDELTEYDIMLAMSANNPDLRAIVEFWAEDTQYVWTGVAARAEWIALKQISLGKVALSNTNNGVITEFDVDYQIPGTQKLGANTNWETTASAKPFSKDFGTAIAAGKAIGATYRFAFMNTATLAKLVQTDEAIKFCASYLGNLANMAQTPSLQDVNSMLLRRVAFNGLQIVEVDQDITIELPDGSRSTGNPFENDVVLFSESKVLGKTHWKRPIDMNLTGSVATKAMNAHTLIKKYSEESPVKEVTEGIANLFPAWNLAGRSTLMQINGTSWSK
jgi:protein-tyrosine-phosphatase